MPSNHNKSQQSGWRAHISWHVLPWWRHQMETFSALLAICAGNSPVPGEFPTQRPVTRSFDVFFDVRPNKQLSKQSWGWWFETLSPSLWRHRNVEGVWCHMQVLRTGTSNYIPQFLGDVITCRCPWYLFLAQYSYFGMIHQTRYLKYTIIWAQICCKCS